MFFRRRSNVKNMIAACIGALLYCEWFVYMMQPLFWPRLQCEIENNCVRVLFVADPQLQGDLDGPSFLNPLFIWDADRFIKKTFSVVYHYFKPDVMVYLGDLTDEGSFATMVQFHKYIQRLNDIFDVHSRVVQIWLPGDNDIGGELEPIQHDKLVEFENIFEQLSVIAYRNISFYKVNGITHTYPEWDTVAGVGMGTGASYDKGSQYRIVVSHYPITLRQVFAHKVHEAIRPNIYFCAHDHVSKYVKQAIGQTRESHLLNDYKTILKVPVDGVLHEIYVPTCSYRMGTYKIGYGAAVIDVTTFELKYTVFWSPKRFIYLFFYLIILIACILYCLVYCVIKSTFRLCYNTFRLCYNRHGRQETSA